MIDLYESQRAMRQMRRAAMQRGVVAVLDVGTSKIACLVLRFDGTDRLAGAEGIGAMAGQAGFPGYRRGDHALAWGQVRRDRCHGRDRTSDPHGGPGCPEDGPDPG